VANRILVLGDICVDVNYYGNVHKISPEAPIPIFSIESKEEIPGMSGNVIRNLEAAGNEVISYTKDNFEYPTTKKNRYYAGKHYLYRIDEDNTDELSKMEKSLLLRFIKSNKDVNAVILQDYNKGFFTEEFIQEIIKAIRNYNPKAVIIADGHKSRGSSFYCGVDYLKVNQSEYNKLFPKRNDYKILKTIGENGAVLMRKDYEDYHVQHRVDNVVDVTGAGDTFVSWFTSELAKGETEEWAMDIACIAAGESVKHLGCYAPTFEEFSHNVHLLLAAKNES